MIDHGKLDEVLREESRSIASRLQTYVSEAYFFHRVLRDDLNKLSPESRVLEVGCGVGVLAALIAVNGTSVTAVEPQSDGFGQMFQMRKIIEKVWDGECPKVDWVNGYLSSMSKEVAHYDYVFAINVVEHVSDIQDFLVECVRMLRPGGSFRFICPNYAFPYEPHFNIPTLLTKGLTRKLLARKILSSQIIDGPALWDELSWPTKSGIAKILKSLGLPHLFTARATELYVERATRDNQFSRRKGRAITTVGNALAKVPSRTYSRTPTSLLPIIDCTVVRPNTWGSHELKR